MERVGGGRRRLVAPGGSSGSDESTFPHHQIQRMIRQHRHILRGPGRREKVSGCRLDLRRGAGQSWSGQEGMRTQRLLIGARGQADWCERPVRPSSRAVIGELLVVPVPAGPRPAHRAAVRPGRWADATVGVSWFRRDRRWGARPRMTPMRFDASPPSGAPTSERMSRSTERERNARRSQTADWSRRLQFPR